MRLRLLLLVISFFCCSTLCICQNREGDEVVSTKADSIYKKRPKIGLVLSGGGAKGLAHCGVLAAIDSARLNIDYIAGTSMGAIVGAMYASGYSGRQIEEIANTMDWLSVMLSADRYQDVSIERKDDYSCFIMELPIENRRIKPFTGILEPQGLMLKFHEVFYPIYKIRKFEELSIPFRCIATDIGSGEAVVLKEGSMPYAVRSSMAIPGVVSAVDYKNTKLVDGGIVRNFPVRDVREMGADFVIGVNLFSGLTDTKDMTTMLDVMMQTMNFRDAVDLQNEKGICDVVIEPEVAQYTAASFDSVDSIFAAGKRKGDEFYPIFKQLADYMHDTYGVPYAEPLNRMKPYSDKVKIDAFEVDGLHYTTKSLLWQNLDLDLGHLYDINDINKAFSRAFSSGYYSNLNYDLVPLSNDADDNRVCLHCMVDERPLSLLKVGFAYNNFTSAAIVLGYERKNMTSKHSTSSLKVAVSESFRFRALNRNYFGELHNYYVDEALQFNHFYVPLYSGSQKGYSYSYKHLRVTASGGIITSQRSDAQLFCGYDAFWLDTDVNGGYPNAMKGRINNFFVEFKHRKNTLNRPYMPQTGNRLTHDIYVSTPPRLHVSYANVTDDMKQPDSKMLMRYTFLGEMYQQPSDKFILNETIGIGASYGCNAFVYQNYVGGAYAFMPSHFTFYGLEVAQMNIPTLVMARFSTTYKLVGELYLSAHLNSAVTFKNLDYYIEDWNVFKPEKILVGGGISAGYNLSVLPIEFTMAYSPDYKFNLSVNIGFLF
ncbi:MAG: patatin-like phospholipase family protein [Marinilabiliaceae bacterium]|nr:patatin-like phospholipase family protein [Marinilabiliaceae bacterium]